VVTDDFACWVIPKLTAFASSSGWVTFSGPHTFGEADEMGAFSREHGYGRQEQPLLELQLADGGTVGAGRSQVTHG
jgi:hypothetical protein